jgi:hypothetical protein
MVSIINQGIDEEIYVIDYPEFTAEIITEVIVRMCERVKQVSDNEEAHHHTLGAIWDFLEKVLGAKKGSFSLQILKEC